MAKAGRLISFRLDGDLLRQIDGYSRDRRESTPGVRFSRSDAIRALLHEALAQTFHATSDRPTSRRAPRRHSGETADAP